MCFYKQEMQVLHFKFETVLPGLIDVAVRYANKYFITFSIQFLLNASIVDWKRPIHPEATCALQPTVPDSRQIAEIFVD